MVFVVPLAGPGPEFRQARVSRHGVCGSSSVVGFLLTGRRCLVAIATGLGIGRLSSAASVRRP
eukprot:11208025-Lingulodinium_polyedra.AAC.1